MSLRQLFGYPSNPGRTLTVGAIALSTALTAATAYAQDAPASDTFFDTEPTITAADSGNFFHCDPQDLTGADYPTITEAVFPATVLIDVRPSTELPEGLELETEVVPPSNSNRDRSGGSGVIIHADDERVLVATNTHVLTSRAGITDDRAYTVILFDRDAVDFRGQEVRAELVAIDNAGSNGFDVALLELDPDDIEGHITCAVFGDSDEIRLGEQVVAMGNPLLRGFLANFGRVGAVNRSGISGEHEYIHTDAAINRGNSGGPLFGGPGPLAGEILGLNTFILSPDGGSVGLGFSIPSNDVVRVINRFLEDGEYLRGWLGVEFREMADSEIAANNIANDDAVLVIRTTLDGPAYRGGLLSGDIITAINNESIESDRDFARTVRDIMPGTTADFTVVRGEETLTISVEIGNRNESPNIVEDEAPIDRFQQDLPEGLVPEDDGGDGDEQEQELQDGLDGTAPPLPEAEPELP